MTVDVFLDTNVLVYAYDDYAAPKQTRAQELLAQTARDGNAALSSQVLGEFFVTVTRRIQKPMTDEEAMAAIEAMKDFAFVEIDRPLVTAAINAHRKHRISYWDGLIVAAAQRAGCRRIMSEDLNAGQDYGGVVVENPFA